MTNAYEQLLNTQPPPKDTFRFATVTEENPIRIRLDGDTEALPFTPTALCEVTPGDRVWVQIHGRQMIVLGRVHGPGGEWIEPTLLNGWQNYTTFAKPLRVRKQDGRVEMSGTVRNGTIGEPIFVLPEDMWPDETRLLQASFGSTSRDLRVHATTGAVEINDGQSSVSWITLDQVQFYQ